MNSLERLSSQLEAYIQLVEMSQPAIQQVCEMPQFWEDVDIVQFSAVIEDIFNECKRETALKAKFIINQQGAKDFDGYTMTEDERCWFENALLDGAKKIFNKLSYLSKYVAVPFLFDEGVAITDYDPAKAYTIGEYVRDNVNRINIYMCIQAIAAGQNEALTDTEYWHPESALMDTKGKVVYNIKNNWNTPDAAFTAMNNNIKLALRYYVLSEWYNTVLVKNESLEYAAKYLEEENTMIKNSHQRITPVRRCYDERP